MSGEVQLILIICLIAVLAFFSQEISGTLKKIFAIKGAKLFLPLALASWFVVANDSLVLSGLSYVEGILSTIYLPIMHIVPSNKYVMDVVEVLFIMFLTMGPVIALNFWSIKKTYKPYPYPYLLSTLIWIVSVSLLVILPIL